MSFLIEFFLLNFAVSIIIFLYFEVSYLIFELTPIRFFNSFFFAFKYNPLVSLLFKTFKVQ